MKTRYVAGVRALALAGILAGALAGTGAHAQYQSMSRAEAKLLYAAGGFPIKDERAGPVNRCGAKASPRITFVDLNGDGRKDALFTDNGACYNPDARFFSMAVKEPNGSWRGVGGFTGTAQAVGKQNGWLSLLWTSNGKVKPLAYSGTGYGVVSSAPPPPQPGINRPAPRNADRDSAIFRAAGLTLKKGRWESGCNDESMGAAYDPGTIEQVKDLNGDGYPEAVVTEGGSYCYGNTGTHFWLVSQQGNGSWKLLYDETGIAEFLPTKGVGGWPDISIGGPGFCFPVVRWNGRAYVQNRFAYEGKPCRR